MVTNDTRMSDCERMVKTKKTGNFERIFCLKGCETIVVLMATKMKVALNKIPAVAEGFTQALFF